MDENIEFVPPVKVGDIVEEQTVISEGKRASGVVKYKGYIIFIDDAKVGEVVSFKMEKIFPKFGVAKKI